MAASVTVNDLLDSHVVLDLECLDRIYLNGYLPNLQVGGQVVTCMKQHWGYSIPSPAILMKIGTRFRRDVRQFAETHSIPIVRFGRDDRKIDVMQRHLDAQAATGRSGVAAIGYAQEFQKVFAAAERPNSSGCPGTRSTWPASGSPASTSTCGTSISGQEGPGRSHWQSQHEGRGHRDLRVETASASEPVRTVATRSPRT